jgi:transcriptional regulator with XRE-family HTH domain
MLPAVLSEATTTRMARGHYRVIIGPLHGVVTCADRPNLLIRRGETDFMGRSRDPAVLRRRLCISLQRARNKASMTQREVADQLGWSLSKLIRIENGQVGVSRYDLKALLDLYDITDSTQVSNFTQMAKESKRQLWGPYRDVLNPDFIIYLGFEGAASVIRQFHPLLIPGLLQTEEYAWRVIRTFAPPETSPQVLKRQLGWRMQRQALLDRDEPPQLTFILEEGTIRRGIGNQQADAAIMRRQLDHLKYLGSRAHTDIRILPLTYGVHPGLNGPFVLLEFPDQEDGDMLYLESDRKSLATQHDTASIAFYRQTFEALQKASLSGSAAERVLDDVADQLS